MHFRPFPYDIEQRNLPKLWDERSLFLTLLGGFAHVYARMHKDKFTYMIITKYNMYITKKMRTSWTYYHIAKELDLSD